MHRDRHHRHRHHRHHHHHDRELQERIASGIRHVAEMSIVTGIPAPLGGGAGAGGLIGVRWDELGPAPLRVDVPSNQGTGPDAGMVNGIAIDPSGGTDQIIYASFSDGGIWKSTDGGTTWAAKTDHMPTLWMGAVALDPSDPTIVYAGTGNFFGAAEETHQHSNGVYRSVDGGETWSVVGATVLLGLDVNRIVLPVHDVLLVATIGGIFRSIDGGQHFGNNSPSYDNGLPVQAGLFNEVVLDTATSSTVYATAYGDAIYVSTDSGATFTNLFTPPGTIARIAFAQSTSPDNQTMYASVQGTGSTPWTLYKRVGGGSFAPVSGASAVSPGTQIAYDNLVAIDPQDANRVYLGFVDLWMSTTGGSTWSAITTAKVHSDFHAFVFSPSSHWGSGAPTRFYCGGDGGIATSGNGGASFTNLNEGIATNLLVSLGIGRNGVTNNGYSYAGSQDTATVERRPGFAAGDWHVNSSGDGGPVAVDPWNPQNAYGTGNGGLIQTTNGGVSWTGVAGAPSGSVSLVAYGANSSSVVYAAVGDQLFQSTGGAFSVMHTFASAITAIGTTILDGGTLWIGLLDGTVQRTTSALAGAGATWTAFAPIAGATGQSARAISVDASNIDRVAVAYDGYSGLNPSVVRTRHVMLTTTNGASWVDASGTDGSAAATLPDLPVLDVAFDAIPGQSLVAVAWTGTEFVTGGLYGAVYTSPDGVTWTPQPSGTAATIAAITSSGTQLVAVGLPGAILTSADGVTWTAQTSGAPQDALQGIAWSGSRYVVSDASAKQVLTSTDAVSWSPTAVSDYMLDVFFAGGQFIAVGYNGSIATSPDGLIWTARTTPTTEPLVCGVWSSSLGLYVVGGQGGALLTSPDGVIWTARSAGTLNEIDGIAWSGTRFAAVINTGEVITSTDGIGWSFATSPSSSRLLDIAWSGSTFVAVGDFGEIITSPDGVTWTDHSLGAQTPALIAAGISTVFRSVDLGASWQVFGVGLQTVDCTALALDSMRTPSLLRVATYGRSAFELTTPTGPVLYVMANLGFGAVANGTTSPTLPIRIFNVGSLPVTVTGFSRTGGSSDFSVTAPPALPHVITPGAEFDISIQLAPTSVGKRTATFQLTSTDIAHPTLTIFASGTSV